MSARITLVALLFTDPGREREFERFEARAAEIMARHGGRIERRISLDAGGDPSRPREVHVVTFPDAASFESYRGDPELAPLADLRASAIRRTVVWTGVDLAPFGGSPAR
jgi:uncharacterized protein (DUF1330 family)